MATTPMHQFNVYRIGPEIKIDQIDISFTNASLFMVISSLIILILFNLGSVKKNIIPNNRNIYILYGGSVNLSNSIEIGELENVDGFLIGTSSLKPDIFYGIYKNLKGEN